MAEWNFYIRVKGETATDSGDGLTFNLRGKDGQATPAPVVYVDDDVVYTGYTFNDGDQSTTCSITFTTSQAGSTVTCDYRWKYEASADADGFTEDASVYEVGKEVNSIVGVDVNGRTIVSTSYNPVQNFAGILQWEYMLKAFWTEWQIICDNDYLFDIERNSDGASPRTLTKLKPTTYPRFIDIPDVTDRIHVGVEFVQVTED